MMATGLTNMPALVCTMPTYAGIAGVFAAIKFHFQIPGLIPELVGFLACICRCVKGKVLAEALHTYLIRRQHYE